MAIMRRNPFNHCAACRRWFRRHAPGCAVVRAKATVAYWDAAIALADRASLSMEQTQAIIDGSPHKRESDDDVAEGFYNLRMYGAP